MSTVNEATIVRKSNYPMIEMENAIDLITKNGNGNVCGTSILKLTDARGYIIAEDVNSPENFPSFRTSIMDGYAVVSPLTAGVFKIHNAVLAGDSVPLGEENLKVSPDTVAYITTGSRVPDWATAVVKVEDTSLSNITNTVNININVTKINENIRLVGSDIKLNESIVSKGTRITAIEIALLATVGRVSILCYNKPIVGVISTGNELIEYDTPTSTPTPNTTPNSNETNTNTSKIRDTNRLALIASLQSENNLILGCSIIDYGITPDNNEDLTKIFERAISECDVVITSGGVSMGAADLVKHMLEKLGTVHFGRLNMKPGKPTTFATVNKTNNKCFLFGLPGNPVSCLVCKALIVDPLVDLLQRGGVVSGSGATMTATATVGGQRGMSKQELILSQHATPQYTTEVNATLQDLSVKMDIERPEYHRCVVVYDTTTSTYHAYSTGIQQSSRMLSLRTANALLIVPAGRGVLSKGANLRCVLLSLPSSITTTPSTTPNTNTNADSDTATIEPQSASASELVPEHQYDNFGSCPCCVNSAPVVSQYYDTITKPKDTKTTTSAATTNTNVTTATTGNNANNAYTKSPPTGHTSSSMVSATKMVMRVGVLTVSDRVRTVY